MQEKRPVEIIQAWQEAANNQDTARLLELSDPSIEIVGPRGSVYGHQLLRDWLGRAGLSLESLRLFAKDGVVVVEQQGIWRSVETGEITGERILASRFKVDSQHVVQFARYDSLDIALNESGLSNEDEAI